MLWDPPTESTLLVSASPPVSGVPIAERCSRARVRCAAANPPRPCPLRAVLQLRTIATGGSDGNQKQSSFFVLPKTRTR